ncbi:MAG: hypothetical protein ACYC46_08765 [Acidobacteriaceae bacterium]
MAHEPCPPVELPCKDACQKTQSCAGCCGSCLGNAEEIPPKEGNYGNRRSDCIGFFLLKDPWWPFSSAGGDTQKRMMGKQDKGGVCWSGRKISIEARCRHFRKDFLLRPKKSIKFPLFYE